MEDNILGFPGYHITREGKLYNKGHPVKTFFHKGYERTKLRNNKVSKNVKIHRLVAEAYIPNPNNLPVVMHLDNNPLNNKVSNLKWGTYKENTKQMMREGRNKGQFSSKLSLEQMREVVRLYDSGKFTLKELSTKFNCKNMSRIVRRVKGEVVK